MKMKHYINIAICCFLFSFTFSCAAQAISIKEHQDLLPGDYRATHAKVLREPYTPYVEEFASMNKIDLTVLIDNLFPDGLPKQQDSLDRSRTLSSYRFLKGDWTFFRSNTVVLYELLRIAVSDMKGELYLGLFSDLLPDAIITEPSLKHWHIALIDSTLDILSNCAFSTPVTDFYEAKYDMLYTNLFVKDGKVFVQISYASTGGTFTEEQEFTMEFEVMKKQLKLKLISTKETTEK